MNKNGEVVWQTTVSEQTPFIVKFVLKLFQTYKIPIIFFIFAMTLPLLPSPKTMTNLQGCRQNVVYSETFKIIEDMDLFLVIVGFITGCIC